MWRMMTYQIPSLEISLASLSLTFDKSGYSAVQLGISYETDQ